MGKVLQLLNFEMKFDNPATKYPAFTVVRDLLDKGLEIQLPWPNTCIMQEKFNFCAMI